MKRYIVGLSLFVALVLSSCKKDFLERYPLDKISNETFWNTENDLLIYNNGLYNMASKDVNVPIMLGHGSELDGIRMSPWYLDEFSDNIVINKPRHDFLAETRSGKQTVPASNQYYGWGGWGFVRAINIGLAHYDHADISEETINKYAAEAKLFRGWFYADKVNKFGDVPWVGHELNVDDKDELYGPRTPREQVMDSVLADLNFACAKLSNDWGDGNAPGRLNRWAALLVKSRVCLFEGTWRKYHGGNNPDMWLQQAADAAKELIDNGPYHLYSTGDPLHDYNAYQRATDLTGNSEVIYWRKYQSGIVVNNIMAYWRNQEHGRRLFVHRWPSHNPFPAVQRRCKN